MASEQDQLTLPTELDAWLTSRVDETEHSKSALLARAVASYRLLSEVDDDPDALDRELTALESAGSVDSDTAERLDALESAVDDRFDELKERIIDVLKETRNRAPEDHDHPELATQLDELSAELSSLKTGHEELTTTHEALLTTHEAFEDTVDDELSALSEQLDSATDSFEALETRSDRLAGAVVDLRRRLSRTEQELSDRRELDSILGIAHEEGLSKATCESCRSGIELGLLRAPWCPHCEARFASIEPRSFFRRPLLTVVDRPALEAGDPAPPNSDIAPSNSDTAGSEQTDE